MVSVFLGYQKMIFRRKKDSQRNDSIECRASDERTSRSLASGVSPLTSPDEFLLSAGVSSED